jgi:hypothetical protein
VCRTRGNGIIYFLFKKLIFYVNLIAYRTRGNGIIYFLFKILIFYVNLIACRTRGHGIIRPEPSAEMPEDIFVHISDIG